MNYFDIIILITIPVLALVLVLWANLASTSKEKTLRRHFISYLYTGYITELRIYPTHVRFTDADGISRIISASCKYLITIEEKATNA